MGKVKIAQTLTRAGLHLGATTVGPILKEDAAPKLRPNSDAECSGRKIIARNSDHIWHIDLTAVPTGPGLWVPWLPFALPQRYPLCWWLGVVVDHFSRRTMRIGVFASGRDTGRSVHDSCGLPQGAATSGCPHADSPHEHDTLVAYCDRRVHCRCAQRTDNELSTTNRLSQFREQVTSHVPPAARLQID